MCVYCYVYLSITRVLIIKGMAYFRHLTFHLADRHVPPMGTRPVGDKHLFKPQWWFICTTYIGINNMCILPSQYLRFSRDS